MNLRIDSSWISRLISLLIMAAVIKAAMFGISMFLPYRGTDFVSVEEGSFYDKYKPSQMFALKTHQNKKVIKKAPVYKLDKLLLKAIYGDSVAPFIAVQENRKVTLISKGESFKGYKLVEVHPQKAIFEKNGRRYELAFKNDKNSNISYSEAVPEIISDSSIEEKAVFIKRKKIQYYVKNYDEIWKNIKIKEIIKDRRLKGFKVTWIKKGSVFEKMGLLKDDIILGANGKTFKSLSQVFKIYNNMDKLDSLVLKIRRDNEERELEYELF